MARLTYSESVGCTLALAPHRENPASNTDGQMLDVPANNGFLAHFLKSLICCNCN